MNGSPPQWEPRPDQGPPPASPRRARLVRVALLLAFGIFTAQLWRLQVVERPQHATAAEANRIRLVALPALRGVIYDRNGELLAWNAPTFTISIVEADLPKDRRAEVIARLAELLRTTPQELEGTLGRGRVAGDRFSSIRVREQVPREMALTVEEYSWQLPGVQVSIESARQYVDSPALAHVLGYLGQPTAEEYELRYQIEGYGIREKVGEAGVEATYEEDLRGRPGARLVEIDAGGRPLRELRVVPPEQGKNLQLTIDLRIQRAVEDILRARLPAGSPGVAIVSHPHRGEILAMASVPGYDPNVFASPYRDLVVAPLLTDPSLPLFHRAIAGQYPPGSVFKLAVAAGALQAGIARRDTIITSNGGIAVPHDYNPRQSTWLPDWRAHGRQNFIQGLANSSNVYFYYLGGGFEGFPGLGNEKIADYARLLGYGEATGIDLPGEEAGRVPTAQWKKANFGQDWVKGDTYNMSIGQGFVLTTPLQVANVTNTIANGGFVVQPHVGKAVLDADGKTLGTIGAPPGRVTAFRSDVLAVLWEGMEAVLNTDLSASYRLPAIRVAGKTGTAEFGLRDSRGNQPTHGWFTAFAPIEQPEVSVTVFMERGTGPAGAVPITMEILRVYFGGRAEGRG